MAKKRGQQKQRSQGGGRRSNSEPRVQVFKEFTGCNLLQSPRDSSQSVDDLNEQSDMLMSFVVVQNNIDVTPNKTLETRQEINDLFTLDKTITDQGVRFTGVSKLVKDKLYLAASDGNIYVATLGNSKVLECLSINDKMPAEGKINNWQSLEYYDDKLIGTTEQNELWTADLNAEHVQMSNATEMKKPDINKVTLVGHNLEIQESFDQDHPFRFDIACTYVNKYGPTETSNRKVYYANVEIDEWHAGCYAQINGSLEGETVDGIQAVELYFSSGNASTLLFLGRVDLEPSATSWTFNWMGYLDATSMWPMGNLQNPVQNFTKGAPASHLRCIDGRLYFWGDKENPYRLYIGGNPGNLLSISPGTGGGFVDVEPGTGQEVRYVCKYKTQSGASIVTMLCDSPNTTHEQRFNLVENALTISNEQTMKSWQAEQVAGAVGCKSYYGAQVCEDGLYSISRYGLALTTMTMEYNSQIQTNYVSDPIKPAFVNALKRGTQFKDAVLLHANGILYMALANDAETLDNIMFCYDIANKSWWTYSAKLTAVAGKEEPIRNIIHIDYEGYQEGIGIITDSHVWLLPTTSLNGADYDNTFHSKIITGELAPQMPQQGWFYLSQLEFDFDNFKGKLDIDLIGIDQFGRKVTTHKHIEHDEPVFNWQEYMRVDLRLRSYKLVFNADANFRMTHFMAKLFVMSGKVGLVWGFDDRQSFRSSGDIHPTFKDYNDIKKAIIP